MAEPGTGSNNYWGGDDYWSYLDPTGGMGGGDYTGVSNSGLPGLTSTTDFTTPPPPSTYDPFGYSTYGVPPPYENGPNEWDWTFGGGPTIPVNTDSSVVGSTPLVGPISQAGNSGAVGMVDQNGIPLPPANPLPPYITDVDPTMGGTRPAPAPSGGGPLPQISVGVPGTNVDLDIGGMGLLNNILTGGLVAGGIGSIFGGGGGGGGGGMGPSVQGQQPGAGLPVIPPLGSTPTSNPPASMPQPSGPHTPPETPNPSIPVPPPMPNGGDISGETTKVPVPPVFTSSHPTPGGDTPPGTNNPSIPVVPGIVTPTAPSPSSPNPSSPNPTMPTIPNIGSPTNRSFLNEGLLHTSNLNQMGGGIFDLYNNFANQYGQSDLSRFGNLSNQFGAMNNNLTSQAAQQTQQANTALRTGNLQDLQNLSGQYNALRQQANPELYAGLNRLDQMAANGVQPNQFQNQLGSTFSQGPQFERVNANTAFDRVGAASTDAGLNYATSRMGQVGPGSIQNTLEQQASSDLALGRSLSPEQERDAVQSARAAYSARGLGNSNAAMAAEVLNRDAAATARQNERRNFAQGVDAQGFNQRMGAVNTGLGVSQAAQNYANLGLTADRSNQAAQLQGNQLNLQGQMSNQGAGLQSQAQNNALGLNLAQMDYGRQQQAFQNQAQAAAMRANTAFDPFSTILGQNTTNQGTNNALFGQASSFGSGQQGNTNVMNAFSPFQPYAQDVANSNFNAENARLIAQQNNSAALAGARDSTNAALANSFLNAIGSWGSANNWFS